MTTASNQLASDRTGSDIQVDPSDNSRLSVPLPFWIAAGVIAILNTIPFLVTRFQSATNGSVLLPVGFLPKDVLQYVAMIRQTAENGGILLNNPFTTEAQSGRFILLFFQILGWISRITGLDPFWVFELSRIPLMILFVAALWWFLKDIFPNRLQRSWAMWLVLFSGGYEFIFRIGLKFIPQVIRGTVEQDMSYGWSMFQSFQNPYWIAAFTLSLYCLAWILKPERLQTASQQALLWLALVVLYFIHPYTFIAVVAAGACAQILRVIFNNQIAWKELTRCVIAFAAAAIVIGIVNLWQSQDAVYRESAGHFFGDQAVSIFWDPIGLGLVGLFALTGFKEMVERQDPYRFALAGWIAAICLLHSSPIINGYKFIIYLYIPVCIAATPSLVRFFKQPAVTSNKRLCRIVVAIGLFGAVAPVTYQRISEVEFSRTDQEILRITSDLAARGPANVLAPPVLGNIIPAFTHHRVYVGHWFLTPDYNKRCQQYGALISNPEGNAAALLRLIEDQKIRYLLTPSRAMKALENVLGTRLESSQTFGQLTVLTLAYSKQTPVN